MIVAGLTGSVGAGKSLCAAMLRHMGIPVLCSDDVVHGLMAPGGAAVPEITRRFAQVQDRTTGAIDRRKLGAIVFADPCARRDLESIVHPMVHAAQKRFLGQVSGHAPLAVLDIPLLFETGAERRCDVTICVVAPRFVREQRVLRRSGMTRERIEAIHAAQMSDREKMRRADYIVRTGLSRAKTFRALKAVVSKILEKKT